MYTETLGVQDGLLIILLSYKAIQSAAAFLSYKSNSIKRTETSLANPLIYPPVKC